MKRPIFLLMSIVCLLGVGCVPSISKETKPVLENSVNTGTILDLSNQGLTKVSQDVFKKTSLTELNLSNNQLAGSLPGEIRFLSNLEVLDASNNQMTGVPAEIGQLSHLRVLNLGNNQLTGLPLELGNLTSLETLDLRGNKYSQQDLSKIKSSLSNTRILTD